jgi:hypothetical protein
MPEGRFEKYYRAIASAAIATVVGVLVLLALTALSVFLENTLPTITLRRNTFTYHAMDIRQLYNYPLFVPIALALTLIFRRSFLWRIVAFVVFWQLWGALAFTMEPPPIVAIGSTGIISLVLLIWILFLALLYRCCMKKPLVGQTKQY